MRQEGVLSSVDVVVPCYNYARFLEQCVDSLLAQVGIRLRVLIIDDASSDDTPHVGERLALRDRRVSFQRHEVNRGHIATYNEGIEWASSDYMLILSADDYLLPGALGRAADLMDVHSEVGFTFGNVIELSDSGTETPIKSVVQAADKSGRRILEGLTFIELSGASNIVSTCTAVVRTTLQKRLGGYRAELPHAGDMEMWLSFAAHASVGFVFADQGVYRRHCANMSSAYNSTTTDGVLADFLQRKSALDCFIKSCSYVLPNSEQLHRWLLYLLADHAVRCASGAFNDGEMEASKRLSEFAIAVCPHIRRSLAWMKLSCKRRMGLGVWRILQPAAAKIRGEQLEH